MPENVGFDRKLSVNELSNPIEYQAIPRVNSYHEHWHEFYEWIFYYDCDGYSYVNNNKYPITNGTTLLLTPFDFHKTEIHSKGANACHARILFTKESLLSEIPQSAFYINKEEGYFSDLLPIFDRSTQTERNYLLSAMLNHIMQNGIAITDNNMRGSVKPVREALEYMYNNFRTATLSSTAAHIGVSSGYLSTIFTHHCGNNFESKLTELRINYAKALLSNTEKKIIEIAFDCGYNNLSNFFRTFKRHVGCTPKEYRKEE